MKRRLIPHVVFWAKGPEHPDRVRPFYAYRLYQCVGCPAGVVDGLVNGIYCDRCWLKIYCT